jgi:nucleoside-diphosphate-sugar epimerase
VHTAALSDDKATLKALLPSNVTGTERLLQQLNPKTCFIHISSSSVYLPQQDPITEDLAGKQTGFALSNYGKSKLLAEKAIINSAKNEQVFILRPRAFYGAGDRVILPRMLKVVKTGKEKFIQRPGKMEVAVSLTHYSTIAHAIDCAINATQKGIHVYNVSDHHTYQLIHIIRKLTAALYGIELKEKEVSIGFMKVLSWFKIGGITPLLIRTFTHDMVLDTSKITRELGFQPTVTFDDQLPELIQWIQNNGGAEELKKGLKYLAWTSDL